MPLLKEDLAHVMQSQPP